MSIGPLIETATQALPLHDEPHHSLQTGDRSAGENTIALKNHMQPVITRAT